VTHIASILLPALTVLIALSENAFAGPAPVPEPGTLTLLAAGVGALAAIKILPGIGRRIFAARSPAR
jgi:hypothetical protein